MILAFSIKEPTSSSDLEERFGRASFFLMMNSKSKASIVIQNSGKDADGSAGIKAIQMLKDQGVQGIVAPRLGPKAMEAAKKMGLSVWNQGDSINVAQGLTRFEQGELEKIL